MVIRSYKDFIDLRCVLILVNAPLPIVSQTVFMFYETVTKSQVWCSECIYILSASIVPICLSSYCFRSSWTQKFLPIHPSHLLPDSNDFLFHLRGCCDGSVWQFCGGMITPPHLPTSPPLFRYEILTNSVLTMYCKCLQLGLRRGKIILLKL